MVSFCSERSVSVWLVVVLIFDQLGGGLNEMDILISSATFDCSITIKIKLSIDEEHESYYLRVPLFCCFYCVHQQ